MMKMKLTLFLSSLVLLASGCGLRRVPMDVLEKLPYEAKIELLEAENDLALAVDRLELGGSFAKAPGFQVGKPLIVENVGRLGLRSVGQRVDVVVLAVHAAGEAGDGERVTVTVRKV